MPVISGKKRKKLEKIKIPIILYSTENRRRVSYRYSTARETGGRPEKSLVWFVVFVLDTAVRNTLGFCFVFLMQKREFHEVGK